MFVTMKEEKNNLKYQETINVDIKNISSKKNHFGYQYMKLLMSFSNNIWTNVKRIQMNIRVYHLKSNQL